MIYDVLISSKDKYIFGSINKDTKAKFIVSCNDDKLGYYREWHENDIVFIGINTKKNLIDIMDTILRWC